MKRSAVMFAHSHSFFILGNSKNDILVQKFPVCHRFSSKPKTFFFFVKYSKCRQFDITNLL